MLSDGYILKEISSGNIIIDPFNLTNLQPISYDIRLGQYIKVEDLQADTAPNIIDLHKGITERSYGTVEVPEYDEQYEGLSIQPKQFMLAESLEHIELSRFVGAQLHGKSTLGRVGLLVHITAGLIDPGWRGKLTLELYNVSSRPIRLWRGMKIGQIEFYKVDGVVHEYGNTALGSHYQDAKGVQEASSLRP